MVPFTSFRVTPLCFLFVAFAIPSVLSAQTATAAGRAVRPQAADSIPVPGVRVLLHRVGRDTQGPVDSTLAGADGRFRFRFRPDTSAVFLLSARYGGIEYFSRPLHADPPHPDTTVRLVVYDTSSTAPIGVEARHIVVPRANPDGSRSVIDLVLLRNDGPLARVAPDSAHPTWSLKLPPGTGGMEVGESDVSPDAVARSGDSVKVLAPLAPGRKQLSLQYAVVPTRGRIEFAVGPGMAAVNVLVEERDARVSGGTLALADSQVIEGRSFRRWTGRVPAGGTVTLTVGDAATRSWRVLAGLVGGVALALALAGWRLLRRASHPALRPDSDVLLDALAVLDARYLGRKAETSGDEWRAYEAERARLRAALEAALAGPSPRR